MTPRFVHNLDDIWVWVHQPKADTAGLVALPPFLHCIQSCGVHMTGTAHVQQNLLQWLLSEQGFSLRAHVGVNNMPMESDPCLMRKQVGAGLC